MGLIDIFKTKCKHLEFFGKTICVLLILSMLTLLSWAHIYDEIKKLSMECQAGNKEACARLAGIAKNDKDWLVRRYAVENLTDQAVLAEIAKKDIYRDVRMAAVENPRFTDQALLAEIAKNDKIELVREVAVERLKELKKKQTISK